MPRPPINPAEYANTPFVQYDYPVYPNGAWRHSPDPEHPERNDLNIHANGMKGPGFATVTTPNGSVMTEYSVGTGFNGDLFPTIYEGITPWDLQTVRNHEVYGYDPLFQEVVDRAHTTALIRAMQGKPPFWTPEDAPGGLLYDPRPKNW